VKISLVTGGAGFIGSHMVEALMARGDRVVVVDDLSTGAAENLAGVMSRAEFCFEQGSVRDAVLVERLVGEADEDYHLAAAVGVRRVAEDPIHTIETNINPTENVLRAAHHAVRRGRAVKVYIASTSEVYGKNPKPRWDEDDDLVFGATSRPRWSYGVTKAIDEFLALAYYRQHGVPVVVGRFFNIVGPRQTGKYGMVVPRFVDAALTGGPLTVYDDGGQTRCFAHVADAIRAVMQLMAEPQAVGQVFNIGSDQPVTILELAKRVVDLVNPTAVIEFQSYADAYDENFEDIRNRVPDLSKIENLIAARPRFGLDEIIRDVAASRRS
jgi:UDP-glucose 4-epimerase